MLVKSVYKNLSLSFLNVKIFNIYNYFFLSDWYLHFYLKSLTPKNFLLFLDYVHNSVFFNTQQLLDIKCDDISRFSNIYRFKLTYVFLNIYSNVRFFFTIFVKEHQPVVSVVNLYNSAGFLEREVWDEFGVIFLNKNNQETTNKRILMDYGFRGHPLKKNYPLTGFYEYVFSYEKLRVCSTPLHLLQEYRKYTFKNYIL